MSKIAILQKLNNIDKQKRLLVMIVVWLLGISILSAIYFLVWLPSWQAKLDLTRIETTDMLEKRLASLTAKDTPEVLSEQQLQLLYNRVPKQTDESEWLRTLQELAETNTVNLMQVQYESTEQLAHDKQEIVGLQSSTDLSGEIESPITVIDGSNSGQQGAMSDPSQTSEPRILRHQYTIKGSGGYNEWMGFLQQLQMNERVVSLMNWSMEATNMGDETIANLSSAKYTISITVSTYQLENVDQLNVE